MERGQSQTLTRSGSRGLKVAFSEDETTLAEVACCGSTARQLHGEEKWLPPRFSLFLKKARKTWE